LSVSEDFTREIQKNLRNNMVWNYVDGSVFWFANSFIASTVILPLYVSHFTDNNILIGLIAVISSTSYFLPQLFTANWVEHTPVKKDFPVKIGLISERLPMVLMPFATFFLAIRYPVAALVAFFLLYFWQIAGAGLVSVGWQDMLAKVIPLERRGLFLSVTNFSGTFTGIAGAAMAVYLLDHYPFPMGYTICFALAGFLTMISWYAITQVREPPSVVHSETVSTTEYWKKLPAVLKNDRNFRRFLISQSLANLGTMAWGFMAVYVKQRWGIPEGFVAGFTAAVLIGQSLGNLLFGMLADRFGIKLIVEIGAAASVLGMLVSLVAPSPEWFYIAFGFSGISAGASLLSMLIGYEFSADNIRPTYIGLNNTVKGIVLFIGPMLGGWLAQQFSYPVMFQVALVISLLGFLALRFWVIEPRKTVKPGVPAISQAAENQQAS
jgi:MFS family permease